MFPVRCRSLLKCRVLLVVVAAPENELMFSVYDEVNAFVSFDENA